MLHVYNNEFHLKKGIKLDAEVTYFEEKLQNVTETSFFCIVKFIK